MTPGAGVTTLSLVGSTGSIGTQAIDVVRTHPDRFRVVALGARRSVGVLAEQAQELRPEVVAVVDAGAAAELKPLLPPGTDLAVGPGALEEIAAAADVVLNAVVGFAGLPVTLTALGSGRRLALANKESLIAGGPVVRRVREAGGGDIVPVDSEHSAIHQCLRSGAPDEVARIVITASGGPFRGRTLDELADVTVEAALAHPTWKMGPKITVDSSTLMNKGLEVIEAHELFDVDYERIEVVIHPQSIVHSMVEFADGATVAQLSRPDMRLPIGYALAHPRRWTEPHGRIDWTQLSQLDFQPPDPQVFRCLTLAFRAGRAGGSAPAWLNAANEVAVEAFLGGRIGWTGIAEVVEETLDAHDGADLEGEASVLEADRRARQVAARAVDRRARAA